MATKFPSIPEWFSNKSVLITGGTGFMGKVLISKLLMSCPDVGDIFLLIRRKKDIDSQARMNLILQEEPFKILRQQYPERLKKLIVIGGDTTVEGLSLSDVDKERLISQVSVVFHMAANVRFDLSLKTAIKMNTVSTVNVVALAKQMSSLESFIHISTSFCQCGESVLEERPYQTNVSAEGIIHIINTVTEDILEIIKPQLLGDQPNTYAYSKALSEDYVSRCGLPIGVIRPSIEPLWYPGGRITTSKILHWFAILLLHTIPAYLIDTLLIITGNKPFMVRIQGKVNIGLELLQYYTMKEWIFCNNNLRNLERQLCPADKETFFMNTKIISWNKYLLVYVLGTRQYCLKDDLSTLPRARRVFKYLFFADCLLKIAFGIFVAWIIYTWMICAKPIIATLVETMND